MNKETKVTKLDGALKPEINPVQMTEEDMKNDLSYRLADGILLEMLDNGLISKEEYDKVRRENIRTFKPILSEIML